MNADVLVGHAFYMALDAKQAARRRPYPPLGTLYAASQLRRAGYHVTLFDAMPASGPEEFAAALEAHRPRLVVLFEDSFNFLSKMCLARMRDAALQMTSAAAAFGVPVVVAGSDASDDPAAYLDAGAAAVMTGEADHTVVAVADTLLHSRGRLDQIHGLALASAGVHTVTPARPTERQPDVFGWPARDLVDIEGYRREWQAAHGFFSLNMASTRGCPYHCNWCAKPIWGQRYAMRLAQDVAAEMADIKARYRPDHIWFADDIFGLRPEWTAEFGAAVAAAGAQIPFQIQSRVDLITEQAADGLQQAGCAEVWLGVESGSQRILDAMEKGIRIEDIPVAVTRLRTRGIRVCFFLQLGYPGETWPDIEATRDLLRDLSPDDIGVSVSYPLPGTRFHAAVAGQIEGRGHWNDSADLAMMFRGTYTTPFYRQLHGLLHDELMARRAARSSTADIAAAARLTLEKIESEWARLAREEVGWRSENPTVIPLAAAPVLPLQAAG